MLLGKSQRDKDETRVASIAVTRDGELLWLRRSDDGLLTLPGGHLEPREEPILGAIRELKEETGFAPPANALEYLGDDIVGGSGIHVYSFCVEIPTGEPTGANDPDSEATEFMWLDDLPESEECHVPHYNNVTLKLLGLTDELSKAEGKRKAVKEWRSSDGVRIPHHTSPARAAWDENYFKQLVRVFANGDERRLRKVKVPVSEHLSGHHVLGAVGPGGRDRRLFYSRMVAGGDKLPPIVVRRSGQGWHVVDGNARLTAALKHGLAEMDGYELSDQPIHKSETPPHPDSGFVDEDLWVQAKYRRGGEAELKRFLQELKGLTKASNEYSDLSGEMSAPALEHPDHYYRIKALKHHLATPAHITKGLSDPHPEVRELAHTKILESRLPKVKTYTDFMTEKNGWKKNPDGLHKSEDFLGKSLSAIKPGKKTKTPLVLTNTETFDYSHLIPSPLLRKRFKISVEHIQPRPGLHAFRAVLRDKQNPNPPVEHQGSVQGDIENDSFRSLFAHVPENARGLGLGKALYTAVLAHVFHHHGIKNIKGWEHSTPAHHVHQALVREHGFEGYQPGPGRQRGGVPNTEGPFDDRFGEYQYALKAELTKSIDPSELKVIWNATTRDGPNLVDHTPDLSSHPANIHPDVEDYRRTVVGGDTQHKRKMGGGGITKKVVYSTPTTKFMVKPYHERVVKRIQSWQKFPIQGWAEMTNQALYHAAGLGHVHQKVHVTEHPMQTPHGTVNEPALVVHLNDGFTQAADFDRKARAAYPHVAEAKMSIREKINRQDIHKIAVMDFLSNDLDRHGGNIMFADDGRLLAVDHSRSFQYMSDNSENKWNWKPGQIKNLVKRNAMMEDSFGPYLHSAINVLAPSGLAFNRTLTPDERYKKQMDLLEEFQPIFDEWWPKHRQGIVDTMTHRLNQIKDPEVAGHIKRNFMERVKWMDGRTRDGVENYGVDWYSDKVPWYLPGQKTDEEVAR